MGIFRSEDMYFYKFTCFKDNAWKVIRELGKLNSLDFIDLNRTDQAFNLPYGNTLKRCEEVLRNLIILQSECNKLNVTLTAPESIDDFDKVISVIEMEMKKKASSFFDVIEDNVKNWAKFTTDNLESYSNIRENYYQLIMNKEVLKMANHKYREATEVQQNIIREAQDNEKDPKKESLLHADVNENIYTISTTNVAGVIDKVDTERLRRLIFRITRGKAICITEDIDAEILKSEKIDTPKTMYLVIFQSGDFLNHRIKSICESFMGHMAELPSREEYQNRINDLTTKIKTTKEVMMRTESEIRDYYKLVNTIKTTEVSIFKAYEMYIKKDMIIYQTMNKLVPENQLLHGFFWSDMDKHETTTKIQGIQHANRFEGLQALEMTNSVSMKPPTKINSNEFLESFQAIVNTYGIPDYKEVNPAFFTIITFPFLFGVMFGDVAHGCLLFLFASYMCIYKDSIIKSGSPLNAILGARHLLLLMGFFATFCGLLYNDMMAIPIETFGGSCYLDSSNDPMPDCVYPFGVDPRWYRSKSAITFVNSLKMKLSVIFAIAQMSMGVCMKAFNAVYFRSTINFVFEFVPQIVLMLSLFGYMDVLIVLKWLTDYTGKEGLAPSIINTMINIPLKGAYIEGLPFFSTMETNVKVSLILLLIAVICVPVMLIPKPLILISRIEKHEEEHEKDSNQKPEKRVLDDEEEKKYVKFDEEPEHLDQPKNQKIPKLTTNISEQIRKASKHEIAIELPDSKGGEEDSIEFKKKSQIINEGGEHAHDASEIFIHQLIETIEFVLGTISNTASYLRLWALSLAHSQLAGVFFELVLWSGIKNENPIAIFIGFLVFGSATFAVLM
jgi:V-type H+-transporting ATPase subunit a